MTESPFPPFFRIGPERPASPVILSVPHAGRDYGPHLLNAARLRKEVLETLEDRLVDRLIWRATALGMTAFVARAPRLEIDLNREERELDPTLIAPPLASGAFVQSARTRGGLGLIPSRITGVGPDLARAHSEARARAAHRYDPPPLSRRAGGGAGSGQGAVRRCRPARLPFHAAAQPPGTMTTPGRRRSCSATVTAARSAATCSTRR